MEAPMATMNIKITKAGKSLPVELSELPDEAYQFVIQKGLEALLNARMSKILTKDLEGEKLAEAQAAAEKVAEENLSNLKAGKISKGRASAKDANGNKVSAVVMTEARRLAKEVVKNEIRAAGMKISHVEASVITKAANELIAADPSFIESATANIEGRKQVKSAINIADLVHESPKLVAKAEKAKAERKTTLSAKQAGKAAPRKAKATPEQVAH
jgi:hypothetical protein